MTHVGQKPAPRLIGELRFGSGLLQGLPGTHLRSAIDELSKEADDGTARVSFRGTVSLQTDHGSVGMNSLQMQMVWLPCFPTSLVRHRKKIEALRRVELRMGRPT